MSDALPFRELLNWQGKIALAAKEGNGLDSFRVALNWAKQNVPPDNGLREKAKQEIREAAERHLADIHGLAAIDAIYVAAFPDETNDFENEDMPLNDVRAFLSRFIIYPSEDAKIAHALWIVHTHLMKVWESTPRLAFLSPEPASGKTRALEITELLVPSPVEAVNVSPAYLFRKVGSKDGLPTILYDEIDTVFGPKAKENEEIRGLLNAGHRRGAVAGRCVVKGNIVETEEIPAYCAVALAGLGWLPETLLSRSVILRMRKRKPGERDEPYRRRVHERQGHVLRGRLSRWAASVADKLTDVWPDMPNGVEDRDADMWEPLLVVADAAGGDWPNLARGAAVTLVTSAKEIEPSTTLADLLTLLFLADPGSAVRTSLRT